MKIGFAGLGVMGGPMAGHLKRCGHEVTGFNRSTDKARAWAEKTGARVGETAAEAADNAEFFILCVGKDDDVREVVTAALPATAPGAVIVDHTTTSAKIAREMAELCSAGGRAFVDAPVSGGQAGAENGQLTVMAGGDEAAFQRAVPVLAAYSKAVTRIGGPGAGQLAKMVNQICIAGTVQGLAEAMHFVKSSGLEPEVVYAAISKGAAQSWQMDNRWKAMTDNAFDFGFAVDWMRKDLGLVLDEARSNGAHLALAALVDQFYSEVQALGGGRWDTSSLAARLEDRRKPRS
ncbi:MAG TPA: NAD(P)-dependent oxidoreductase [Caulobacteraceae bacterium]|nr:NAD(P)-dependent oxidoreductase [Caulobacteraceae bacterium]